MKKYRTEQLRNIGLISHGGSGKTSLTEAMVFNSGAIDRLGRVDAGTTLSDHDPDEIKRNISINTSVVPCEWKEIKINIVDTPGYSDFIGDVVGALRVVDGVFILIDAVAGVEVGTENVRRIAGEQGIPTAFFINKMDRENANFQKAYDSVRDKFGNQVVAVQIPIGSQDSFKGVVDLLENKAYVFSGSGREYEVKDVPADIADEVEGYRASLIESSAEFDDEVLMKYLEGEELTDDEIKRCVKIGILSGKLMPMLCGSALKNIAVQPLMDFISNYMPSPADMNEIKATKPASGEEVLLTPSADKPFSALVFKTMADPYVGKLTMFRVYSGSIKSDSHVYNLTKGSEERFGQLFVMQGKNQIPIDEAVAGDIASVAKLQETATGDTLCAKENPVLLKPIDFPKPTLSMAIFPKAKGDEEKISSGLSRLAEEDPTFDIKKEVETGELVVSGMGELHLEVIAERLKRKFGVEVTMKTPTVPYRETIKGTAKVEGKHKKQSGGRGQYGHVWIEIEPLPPGGDFEFVDKIFGGAVPRQYIPAVEKGIRETLVEGVYAGFSLVDIRVTLYDGSYHPVDSSEMAFKIAASMALKKGVMEAKPILLEPIMFVQVTVPEEYMGDVMGDLNKKRGRIIGMEPQGENQVVKAYVPLGEMFKYSIDLRSITQGRGSYVMEHHGYEEVPAAITEKIVEERKKEQVS